MKGKLTPHIIAVMALVVFIMLGLASSATTPETAGGGEVASSEPITTDGMGTFSVTGIPSQYNGKYALFMGENNLIGSTGPTSSFPLVQIANGNVSLPVWIGGDGGQRYSGNDTVGGEIGIFNSETFTSTMITDRTWSSIAFSNGSAVKTWSSGK